MSLEHVNSKPWLRGTWLVQNISLRTITKFRVVVIFQDHFYPNLSIFTKMILTCTFVFHSLYYQTGVLVESFIPDTSNEHECLLFQRDVPAACRLGLPAAPPNWCGPGNAALTSLR